MIVTQIRNAATKLVGLLFACLLSTLSFAAIDVYDFDSVQQEAQYRGLIEELRCPKCQNQNLAGSDAPIAQDLKQKTYDMIKDGRSDGEIRAYMQERYGDFITYKPPVRPSTWILWFFPPLLLLLLVVGWFWQSKRRQLVASGQSGVTVDSTATELSAAEKAELDRLLSRAKSDGKTKSDDNSAHDIKSREDKK
ncbi:cytochrome c-type biogenesis protein [Psychrobacter sp.]|uniref:cytochrome c-type biogenesis protein n=1 Tax=Psychrobacter sp. TaxID=56811 RepID=UPI0026470D08|nr:cytochrome c-type biogenesis protein [Psychrobacter sp.]MDN6275834.1 cytochrome c-type biogenesis protein CcmH [Psychrobacter sp.]MDN6307104.1 cytochrome c-type biogenesis protein CcmH [Psychrobacter sp.]